MPRTTIARSNSEQIYYFSSDRWRTLLFLVTMWSILLSNSYWIEKVEPTDRSLWFIHSRGNTLKGCCSPSKQHRTVSLKPALVSIPPRPRTRTSLMIARFIRGSNTMETYERAVLRAPYGKPTLLLILFLKHSVNFGTGACTFLTSEKHGFIMEIMPWPRIVAALERMLDLALISPYMAVKANSFQTPTWLT